MSKVLFDCNHEGSREVFGGLKLCDTCILRVLSKTVGEKGSFDFSDIENNEQCPNYRKLDFQSSGDGE